MDTYMARQALQKPYVAAIIPAAGSATRMGNLDKQFEEVGGVPVLARSMAMLSQSDWVDELVVVVKAQTIPLVLELIRAFAIGKVKSVVAGGETRQQSVQKGIAAVSPQTAYVAIHDGARPMVTSQVIADTILDAFRVGAAAAAVPVVDTIKVADEKRNIAATPDRSRLFAVQTPQVFLLEAYREAAGLALEKGVDYTDDCQMFEAAGRTVYLSQGAYSNLKITTPIDLIVANATFEMLEL